MKRLTALALLVIGPSIAVNAAPTLDPATGKSYLVVAADSITWDAAKIAAASLIDRDLNGHLVTITSAEEFAFVDQLRQQAGFAKPQVWIGGSQSSDGAEPGGGWTWENGEGPIPGADSASPYANWATNEPNNSGGNEEHLTLGRFTNDPGFNDEGSNPSSIGGYIVEFEGGTVAAATCTDSGTGDAGAEPGCNPSGVVRYVIPAEALNDPSNTVTAGLVRPGTKSAGDALVCPGDFVYRDPRVANDGFTILSMVSLDVFGMLGGTTPPSASAPNGVPLGANILTLDQNTYGSPCFAVVQGSTDGFDIQTGTVLGTQLAEDVPGIGNVVFSCNRTQGDLQKRTQYTYMTTDPAGMAEGGAAAMTSACVNPTTSTTKRKSFDVLNTHESCGIIVTGSPTTVPAAVRLCFEGLANGKFNLLDAVLVSSKPALNSPKFSTLSSKVNQARSLLKLGQYQKSQNRLKELLTLVNGANFDGNDENYQGDLIMRTNNLLFRLQELKCPAGSADPAVPAGGCL